MKPRRDLALPVELAYLLRCALTLSSLGIEDQQRQIRLLSLAGAARGRHVPPEQPATGRLRTYVIARAVPLPAVAVGARVGQHDRRPDPGTTDRLQATEEPRASLRPWSGEAELFVL